MTLSEILVLFRSDDIKYLSFNYNVNIQKSAPSIVYYYLDMISLREGKLMSFISLLPVLLTTGLFSVVLGNFHEL